MLLEKGLTQLFIRACKTSNANKSVYRRFYWHKTDYTALASILSTLIDEHCPMSTAKLVDAMSPSNYPITNNYHEKVLYVLINRIRFYSFEGLTKPARFRK